VQESVRLANDTGLAGATTWLRREIVVTPLHQNASGFAHPRQALHAASES
jgi:hypothetical protein